MKAYNFIIEKNTAVIKQEETNGITWNFGHDEETLQHIRETPELHKQVKALFIIKHKKQTK